MQVPEAPSLESIVGAGSEATILWLLVVMVLGGMSATAIFMWRQVKSTDRIALALEGWPAALDEKLENMQRGIDKAVQLAEEHVRIARMWERTEFPGRVGKGPSP